MYFHLNFLNRRVSNKTEQKSVGSKRGGGGGGRGVRRQSEGLCGVVWVYKIGLK